MERFRTFTVLIAKINRSIRRIKSDVMQEYDLKSPHVSCLYYLYKEDSLTAKELSDICDEDKAALSRSIDQLEKRGLIVCDSDTKKRYKAPLALTEEGKGLAAIIAGKVDEVLDFVGECLSEDDRIRFYDSLETVSKRLDDFHLNNN